MLSFTKPGSVSPRRHKDISEITRTISPLKKIVSTPKDKDYLSTKEEDYISVEARERP